MGYLLFMKTYTKESKINKYHKGHKSNEVKTPREEIIALREENKLLLGRFNDLNHLLDNIQECIFKLSDKGRFTYLSSKWKSMTGYKVEESLDTGFDLYIYNYKAGEGNCRFTQLMAGEIEDYTSEFLHLRKDGSAFWAMATMNAEFDEAGNIIGAFGSITDVSKRKNAEINLKEQEEKFRILANNVKDVISIRDSENKVLYISPSIKQVLGYEPEEIIGKKTYDFIDPLFIDQLKFHCKDAILSRKKISYRFMFRHKDGSFRWLESLANPVFDPEGNFKYLVISSRDMTDRIRLEEELENIRGDLSMDFHDNMGNHLASLAMFVGIIRNGIIESPKVVDALSKVENLSKAISEGTRDFIWAIDPKNDNLKEIFFYLKDFGTELFENSGIDFQPSVHQIDRLNFLLPYGYSRQLIPIFKEGLTNCLKHAASTKVSLIFEVKNEHFIIRLEDNGKGFINKNEYNRCGIKNMYKRAEKINCYLKITSSKFKGTSIALNGFIPKKGDM